MSQERWKQVEEIFQTALDLEPDARGRFIAEACTTDDKLRREVEALIAQFEEAGDFIEAPALADSPFQSGMTTLVDNLLPPIEDDPMYGRRLGAYAIVREIGRGGMGAVYLAARADSEFQKQVAIKLVKRGMDTDFILRRFRNERQILATLDHPHIARLLDGGTTQDGLPYFVMEFIEGQPVHHYCDMQRLSISERLKLFCQICSAVHYAHRNFIIHRDIKPSNILVTRDGMPKLLDFGIAKLLNTDLASDTAAQTATAMRLMTPEYASPEQATGGKVTHATDIYSLGVLLYELVTGHRPYSLRHRAPHEIARVICEETPAYPSHVVTRPEALLWPDSPDGELSAFEFVSNSRRTTLENLQREITGSLDNIIMKALQKEPEQRYQSVEQFSEDLTRYLGGHTVSAPSYSRAVTNLVRQFSTDSHTGEKSIAVLPLKILNPVRDEDTGDDYLGIGLADALITRLSNVRRFVVRPTSSVLRYSDSNIDPFVAGKESGVDYIVDGNIRRVGDVLRVTVQLLSVVENSTHWAGRFDENFTDVLQLEDAISEKIADALVPHLTGDEREQLAKRGTNNAQAYEAYLRGRFHWNTPNDESIAKTIAFYNRAVSLDANYALAYAGIADYYNMLGVYGVLPFPEAAAQAKEAALKAVALDDKLAAGYAALGFAALMHDFDWEASEDHMRRAVTLNPNYALGRLWFGYLFALAGRPDEALPHVRRALELDPSTPMIQHSANWVFYLLRRYDEAIEAAQRTAANDPQYGLSFVFLCIVMSHVGRHEEAIAAGHKSVALLGRTPYMLTRLASAYAEAGQRETALALLEEVKQMSATRYVSPNMLATIHLHLKDYESAFAELERALEIHDARIIWLGVDPQFDVIRSDPRFQELLRRTNNPAPQPRLDRFTTREASGGHKLSGDRATSDPQTGQKSIAILPLKLLNPASETGDDYLRIGLADALITRLGGLRRFILRPTSSVLRYASLDADPLEAGRELDVSFVLEGLIRRAGDRIRITMQLLDVHGGSAVWAGQFDERFTDVLSLEDAISAQVAEALVPQLTGGERMLIAKRGTDDPEAHEAYLRGRYHWHTMTEDGFVKAINCYQRAVTLDPAYAAAYAGIAEYYCWLAVYGLVQPEESLVAAREAAARAVELDDTLAETHTAHGLALLTDGSQWEVASARFLRALELNPNYTPALVHYACQLAMEGRFDESIAEARRAREVDPLNPFNSYILAWCLYQARRYEEGIAQAEALLESEPRYGSARFVMSWMQRRIGEHDEAMANAKRAIKTLGEIPMILSSLGAAYAEAGQTEDARRILALLQEQSASRFVSPYHRALVHLQLGERQAALDLLEQSIVINDPWLVWLAVEPQLDPLRRDPRFIELLKRTGNPAAAAAEAAAAATEEKSIAVLPFKLLGKLPTDETGDEYLGIGLADALITRLSNVRSIHVRPTSAIMRYGHEDADPLAAGRTLTVDFVLEGRIKHAGERIRISLQLLDVQSGASVWAHQFDERFTDVLNLEDAITRQVAEELVPYLTGEERGQLKKRGTDNPEAFEAYLRGRYYWNTFTEEGFAKALICFNRAVAFAPDYALAYTGISDYYTFLGVYAVLPFAETSAAAKEAALTAVALDDQSAEAYAALGMATMMHDFDWETAERHFSHAVELNPNFAIGRTWYAYFLGMTGRFDDALVQVQHALELDPLTPIIRHTLNWTYYHGRRHEESIAATRDLVAREPQYGLGHIFLCVVLSHAGQYEEAIEAGQRAVTLLGRSPYTLVWLASAYASAGQREQAHALLDELQQMSATRYVSPYLLAMVYCNLGDHERTFTELEHALEIHDARLVWLGVDPQFDALRRDARFIEPLRQTNNPLTARHVAAVEGD